MSCGGVEVSVEVEVKVVVCVSEERWSLDQWVFRQEHMPTCH